jgi:hypothetical protein
VFSVEITMLAVTERMELVRFDQRFAENAHLLGELFARRADLERRDR